MAFLKKMKCPKCGWTTEVPPQGRTCARCKAFIAPAPEGRPNLGSIALSTTKEKMKPAIELAKSTIPGVGALSAAKAGAEALSKKTGEVNKLSGLSKLPGLGSLLGKGKKEEKVPGKGWAKSNLTKCKCGGEYDAGVYKGVCPYCGRKKSILGGLGGLLNTGKKKKEEGKTEAKTEEGKKEETKEEKDETKKSKAAIYTIFGISLLGLISSVFFELTIVAIIVFVVLIVLAIIASKLPWWFTWILAFIFIAALFLLNYTGQFEKITTHPLFIVYAQEIDKQVAVIKDEATKLFKSIDCYRKITPDLVDACLKAMEEEGKEGGESFDKTYETLEIKPGNPFKEYEQTQPDNSGTEYFDWEINLANKNEKIFNITVTKVNAWTNYIETPDKTILITENDIPLEFPYNLQPNKALYLRISFQSDLDKIFGNCDSKTFKMNVTSRHNGGTDSWFGMAPNVDDPAWQKFVQGYDPKYEPDPGPLDIFAFTYPFGIDQAYYAGRTDNKKVKLIIKLRNPEADGTIFVDNFYFIQNFKFPNQYFTIDSCTETLGTKEPTDKCDNFPNNNCFMFTFSPTLKILNNQVKEIKCNITINDVPLTDEYEDLMRVYASYNFIQEYEQTLACTGETSVEGTGTGGGTDTGTGTGGGTGAIPACSCNTANDNCTDNNCEGCVICKDSDSKGVCNYGVWNNAPFDKAPCCYDQDCQHFCVKIYPEATCYHPGIPTCDPMKVCNIPVGSPNELCGSTIEECEKMCISTGCT